jgi:hypothetical protein
MHTLPEIRGPSLQQGSGTGARSVEGRSTAQPLSSSLCVFSTTAHNVGATKMNSQGSANLGPQVQDQTDTGQQPSSGYTSEFYIYSFKVRCCLSEKIPSSADVSGLMGRLQPLCHLHLASVHCI